MTDAPAEPQAPAAAPAPPAEPAADAGPRIWTGGLLSLSGHLQAEARATPGTWCWWTLPDEVGGETIGCRAPRAGGALHMVLLTAPERLQEPGWPRRHTELVRYLGLVGWASEHVRVRSKGGEGWRYTEPEPLVPAARLPRVLTEQQQLPLAPERAVQHERAREATGG